MNSTAILNPVVEQTNPVSSNEQRAEPTRRENNAQSRNETRSDNIRTNAASSREATATTAPERETPAPARETRAPARETRATANETGTLEFQQRVLSIARDAAIQSTEVSRNPDLQGLLAFQAYKVNTRYNGKYYDVDIYNGLYTALKKLISPAYNIYPNLRSFRQSH